MIIEKTRPKKSFIPHRFREGVGLHLLGNNGGDPSTPLCQLWQGPTGGGKSSGIRAILRLLKARYHLFDATGFESSVAGQPSADFRQLFDTAFCDLRGGKEPAAPSAIIVNDIDMGVGDLGGNVQYTVNRQHLIVSIMDLADRYAGRFTQRPAVYLTVNRTDVLYPPLIREGRCEALRWEYLPGEREQIVQRIFPHLTDYESEVLVERFQGESIAFFAGLKRLGQRGAALSRINQLTLHRALELAVTGRWKVPTATPSLEELIRLGKEAIANRRPCAPGEEGQV